MRLSLVLLVASTFAGCSSNSNTPEPPASESGTSESTSVAGSSASADTESSTKDFSPPLVELDAAALMEAQLTPEMLDQGWVRLFDNQSLFGWQMVGAADWKVEDGTISVSDGERSYLCTTFKIADFELRIDFRADEATNSGIFMRTGLQPEDVQTQCLELNIAPPDNPFPTGSFVKRQKLEPSELGDFDPTQWHTYRIRVQGNQITVKLDDKEIMNFADSLIADTGHISLQHNSGNVAFRNILLRPIHSKNLSLGDDWQSDWEKSTKDEQELSIEPTDNGLRLIGGLGQLQSKADYGDFWLHARYTLATPDVNSGIFFRCIRDNMLDGYECQVNHAIQSGDPLLPGDGGAGAIFRRQNARIVIGDGSKPTHISLLASGSQISTWVNGVQTVDFQDTRPADENPRRGLRLAPGPISLQGHDPGTDATFETLTVSQLSSQDSEESSN